MQKITLSILSIFLLSWISPPNYSKKLNKILSGSWAQISAGQALVDGKMTNVDEFYISATETSNLDYLEFLKAIKNTPDYQKALPDTTVWSSPNSPNDGFKNQYLRYPGFRTYPVVGVSWEGALLYCNWLEKSINSQLDSSEKVEVKLPTEAEWTRAARGDNNAYKFTWGGPYLENGKGRSLANYKNEKAESPLKNIITAEVYSFTKNQFGIYQMCGNVSEMVSEPYLVKGGSWNSEAEALKIDSKQQINYPSKEVGFRPVLKVHSR